MEYRKLMDITGYEFRELLKDERVWTYQWIEGDMSLDVTIVFDRGEGSAWIQYKNHETRLELSEHEIPHKLRYALDYAQFLDNPMAGQWHFDGLADLALELGQYGLDIVGTADSLSMWTEFCGILVNYDLAKYQLINAEGIECLAGTAEGAATWIKYLELASDRIKQVNLERESA